MKFIFVSLLVVLNISCASRSFERNYEVIDASHQEIPEWIGDLKDWLDDSENDSEQNRYYIYTSEAKNERSTACEIAKARASASVASEVSSYIKQSFAQSKHGDPSVDNPKLSEYVEDNLAKEVQAYLTGVQNYKEYWEQRRFKVELGAQKDSEGFVCSSLVKVSKKDLKRSFNRASKLLDAKVSQNAEAKRQVKEIMEEASRAYLNM